MVYEAELAAWGRHADTAIATLSAAVTAGQVEIEALDLANDQLHQAVADREETITEQAVLIERQRRIIRRLRNPVDPDPELPPTFYGSSCGAHSYDEFTQRAGAPLAARRSYQSGTQRFPAEDVGRCISVVSYAFNPSQLAANLPRVEAWLRQIPGDHDARVIVSHEPENPEKNYSAAAFVTQQEAVRELVNRVNLEREVPLRFGGNFMAWSTRPQSGRNLEPWLPADGTWDFVAWDGYSHHWFDLPGEVFDDALTFSRDHGLRFAIAETGITIDNTPEQRVVWIDQCQQYAADADSEFWMYWDGSFWIAYLNTAEEFAAVVNGP